MYIENNILVTAYIESLSEYYSTFMSARDFSACGQAKSAIGASGSRWRAGLCADRYHYAPLGFAVARSAVAQSAIGQVR